MSEFMPIGLSYYVVLAFRGHTVLFYMPWLRKLPMVSGSHKPESEDQQTACKCGGFKGGNFFQRNTDYASDDRGTGIKVFHKYIWRLTGKDIPQDTSADSGQGAKGDQKEGIIISTGHAGIDAHHSKDAKSDRIHQKHQFIVGVIAG